jgi:protein transport protein SEC61 subunit gamma and related proteins
MTWLDKLKEFWTESIRVMRITKRPNKEEFITIVKVSGAGILIIGAIGFIFHIINQFIIG